MKIDSDNARKTQDLTRRMSLSFETDEMRCRANAWISASRCDVGRGVPEILDPRRPLVSVASTLKVKALRRAAKEVFGEHVEIVGYKVSSGIAEQPFGNEETIRGASNRLANCRIASAEKKQSHDFYVGIENGIVKVECEEEDDIFMDVGWIVIESSDGRKARTHSAGVELDRDIVLSARRRGFQTTTVGSLYAEVFDRSQLNSKDPHAYLTGGMRSRSEFLENALVSAFGSLVYRRSS